MMENDDWFVHDARNGQAIGPYTRSEAENLAERLSRFVHEGSGIARALNGVEVQVRGPFWARSTRERLF